MEILEAIVTTQERLFLTAILRTCIDNAIFGDNELYLTRSEVDRIIRLYNEIKEVDK